MGILLIRYQVCWLLVSGNGEEGGYAAGIWGGQMFRMLGRHSNTVYGRNISIGLEARASEALRVVNMKVIWWLTDR